MPNTADIMRMMRGTMGAGGAPQSRLSSNTLGRVMAPPTPPAATFADNMDPEQLRRLMEMMQRTQGSLPMGRPQPNTADVEAMMRGTMGGTGKPAQGNPRQFRGDPIPPHGGTLEERARDYYSHDYGWINPNVPYSRTGRQIPMSLLPRR